jgi:hypothetical protein
MEAPMDMNLSFSDEQTTALRQQAVSTGQSLQAVAQSAVAEYLARREPKANNGARCWLTSQPDPQGDPSGPGS